MSAAEPRVFPAVSGENLHGETVSFPAAFKTNTCTVVIVAYARKQQEIIDPWLPELDGLARSIKGFEFYELPTIKEKNRVMRWIIHNGMRSGVKDAAARSRTVTLHIDKTPFNRALGVKDESKIYLLVLDREGRELHRETGVFEKAKFERIKDRVRAAAK